MGTGINYIVARLLGGDGGRQSRYTFGPRALHGSIRATARLAVRGLAGAAAGTFAFGATEASIEFDDITSAVGITYVGESYGASWGDYNADGWPDVFTSNHRNPASLYVNLGNGTFEDRAGEVPALQNLPSDQHGASWSDFDNDGDYDLFISAGANSNNLFLVNDGRFLVDATFDYTFERKWGARLPVWFDFSHDGKLDFSIAVQGTKPQLFEQTADDFVRVDFPYGNKCLDSDYTQLADVTRDGILDWICIQQAIFPEKVYDISVKPFADRTSLFPPGIFNSTDTLFADIDGDLVSDAFVLKGKDAVSGAEIVDTHELEAHLIAGNQQEKGISFQSTGDVTIELHLNARGVTNMFIGASGEHPPNPGPRPLPVLITMSADDPDVVGLMPRDSNLENSSIYTGYDPDTNTWQLWNTPNDWNYVYAFIRSTQPVSNLQVFGLITPLDTPREPVFLGSSTGSFVDRTVAVGMNTSLPCNSVVSADFDNDMDLDLYFGCRNAVSNAANRLYENQDGIFVPVSAAGGAAGPTGPGTGLTESVSIGDFDVDGRVDVLSLNGLKLYPEEPYSTGGPTELFRNISNTGNHWIEIDLVGTMSNRDAVGARVVATAGGVGQLREQGGNYRRWTQNHKRLHFGLGVNTTVDLAVSWPSGTFQTFTGVAVDKLYRITEGGVIDEVALGSVDASPCGDAGGLPTYQSSVDRGVFMGKDCITGSWTMRVTAGGGYDDYRGDIISSEPFTSVSSFGLGGSDSVDNSNPNIISFVLGVGGQGEDRIDFSFPEGADVCFELEQPSNVDVRVGHNGVQVPLAFDLETLGPCETIDGPPECDLPMYDAGAERAVFLGKNCSNGVWQFRATAGGSGVTYEGDLISDDPFTDVTGFSLESNDVVDWSSGASQFDYSLKMGGSGQDGFDFSYPDGSAVCVDVDAPQGVPVYLGAGREPMAVPFELETGAPCSNVLPVVSANDVAVSEGAGTMTFLVTLSASSVDTVSVDYATVNGTATASDDYTATGNSLVFAPSETSKVVDVTIIDDAVSEGAETFDLALSNAVNATLGSDGTGTINDNEASPCDLPAYDAGAEQAVFLGKNCSNGVWQFRATAGSSGVTYEGDLISDQPFMDVTGFSLESNDAVAWSSGASQIDYSLRMGGSGQDGFDFSYPDGSAVCVDVDVPQGVPVYLGAGREPMAVPFDLETGGPCSNVLPVVSANDVAISEGAGTMTFMVTLSASSADTVSVDYATVSGTAMASDDYTATGNTLVFAPSETSKVVDVTIIDDAVSEGAETFDLALSNAVNATLGSDGTGTINDNEASPCGLAAYDPGAERAVFLGKNCSNGVWQFRATAGSSGVTYEGDLISDDPFTDVTGFSLESNDVVAWSSGASQFDYLLKMGGSGQDGFDFSYPDGSAVCVDVDAPQGVPVYLGADREPMVVPFELETGAPCM